MNREPLLIDQLKYWYIISSGGDKIYLSWRANRAPSKERETSTSMQSTWERRAKRYASICNAKKKALLFSLLHNVRVGIKRDILIFFSCSMNTRLKRWFHIRFNHVRNQSIPAPLHCCSVAKKVENGIYHKIVVREKMLSWLILQKVVLGGISHPKLRFLNVD